MENKVGVAILGGTGYGAGELLRLLISHPAVEVVSVVSSSRVGDSLADVHPHLLGFYDNRLQAQIDFKALEKFPEKVIFASLPHGVSAGEICALVPQLDALNAKLIDLSGDFRLQDEDAHRRHYPNSVAPQEIRDRFVYGLAEINRRAITQARFIANPGCLASAAIMVAAPMLAAGYEGQVIFDAKTGTSGAGRSPTLVTHSASRTCNMSAYKVLEHRHEPEIREVLQRISSASLETAFVPHLLSITRGIFITAYFSFSDTLFCQGLQESSRLFYKDSPFVRMRSGSPELQHVIGTNFFDFSLVVRGGQVVAMGALDNLGKGMAGSAIQNMNLMCGLPETCGLWFPALGPA